jgi:hypothetical protein
MVLNASYVCLLHSRFIENHAIWILEDGPLISRGVLSQRGHSRSAQQQPQQHLYEVHTYARN